MSVAMAIINYFVIGYAYKKGLGFGTVISHTLTLILFSLLCSSISVVIAYISELHYKMARTITENLKLLNGMHEGLLILENTNELQ